MEVDKRKESILVKLAKYGADTEKKVIAIDKVEVIDFCLSSGLKLEDVHTVYEIQDAMKHNRVYSYLIVQWILRKYNNINLLFMCPEKQTYIKLSFIMKHKLVSVHIPLIKKAL